MAVVLLFSLLPAMIAATGGGDEPPSSVALSSSTVITVDEPGRVLVELPTDLAIARGDVELFAVGTRHVEVSDLDRFTALTLVSADEPLGDRLPKFIAIKLPLPGGPQIVGNAQGFKPGDAGVIPAGSYWLSVAAESGVTVSLEFPSLPAGEQHVVLTERIGYHADARQAAPLTGDTYAPTFSDGFSHHASENSQLYGYVWIGGDAKAYSSLALCSPYGSRQQLGGIDVPGCGGESTVWLAEVALRTPYLSIAHTVNNTRPAGDYRVGGTYRAVSHIEGGGVLWLWVDAPGT